MSNELQSGGRSASQASKLRIGLFSGTPASNLGRLIRTGSLQRVLESAFFESAVTLEPPAPGAGSMSPIDLLVIDGPVPSHRGSVTSVPSGPPPFPELEWLSRALLALRHGVPVVLHDVTPPDPAPEWLAPAVATAFRGAAGVLVTSTSTAAAITDVFPDVAVTEVLHPATVVQQSSTTDRGSRDPYWLVDTQRDTRDPDVTLKLVERCAAAENATLLIVSGHDEPEDEIERTSLTLVDLGYDDAIRLVAEADAVPLALPDLAIAAHQLGVPHYPATRRDPSDDLESSSPAERLMKGLVDAVAAPAAVDLGDVTNVWLRIDVRSDPVRTGRIIDEYLTGSPHRLAALAREARSLRRETIVRRTQEETTRRRLDRTATELQEVRAENRTLLRQVRQARESQDEARRNLAEQRREIRRLQRRGEQLSDTIRTLRTEMKSAERRLDEERRAAKETRLELERQLRHAKAEAAAAAVALGDARDRQQRSEERLAASRRQLERLKDRKSVRLALLVADGAGRLRRGVASRLRNRWPAS